MDVVSAGGLAVANCLISVLEFHITDWAFALDEGSLEAFGWLFAICEWS
jgi:hypothetical protein